MRGLAERFEAHCNCTANAPPPAARALRVAVRPEPEYRQAAVDGAALQAVTGAWIWLALALGGGFCWLSTSRVLRALAKGSVAAGPRASLCSPSPEELLTAADAGSLQVNAASEAMLPPRFVRDYPSLFPCRSPHLPSTSQSLVLCLSTKPRSASPSSRRSRTTGSCSFLAPPLPRRALVQWLLERLHAPLRRRLADIDSVMAAIDDRDERAMSVRNTMRNSMRNSMTPRRTNEMCAAAQPRARARSAMFGREPAVVRLHRQPAAVPYT